VSDQPKDPLAEAKLSKEAAKDLAIVAKGGAIQVVGQILQRSLSFLFASVVVRALGVAASGVYRQVAQTLTLAGQLGLLGFNFAAMRWIARSRAAGEPGGVKGATHVAVFGTLISSAVVFIGLMVLAGPIGATFGDSAAKDAEFARLIRLGAAYVPLFGLLQVYRYCTQAYKTMVPSVIAGNIVQPAVRFILGLVLILAGFEVAGVVVTLVASMGVGAVVAYWYYRRLLTEKERAAEPVRKTGEMVRFSMAQAGASLLGVQSLGLGILLLGIISNDAAVGVFGIALSLQGPANVFLGGIVNIWAPMVSDLHEKGEMDRLGSLYKTINRWIATFSFPVAAVLIIEPDLFVRLFAGKEVSGNLIGDATAAVAILAVGNIFYTGTGPTGYVLSMTGRPGVNFVNSIIGVALYIALGIIVVPDHGVVGMAIVDSVVTALMNSVRVIQAKALVGIQPFGRTFYKPVVATLAGAAVLFPLSFFTDDHAWLEIAGITVATLVYLLVLKLLGLDPEELLVWERIRKRAFKRGRG
jgi:O-antigen/teichoic acid export membrane protein